MSTKVLYLIPRLDCSGAARQLQLLTSALPRPDFEPLVCTLQPDGPLTEPLQQSGVPVEALGWQRWLDPMPAVRLRGLVQRFRPDVIHVWQFPALRLLWLVNGWQRHPVVFSAPLLAGKPPGPFDCWLVRRADAVVVQGSADALGWRQFGVAEERIALNSPAVLPPAPVPVALPASVQAARAQGQRFLACSGDLRAHKGIRDAIWAFDILRFMFDDLQLLLIGSGPERQRLEHFAHDIGCHHAVHWLEERPDGRDLLQLAQVVWLPSRRPDDVNAALEALAAGAPLIAARWPILTAVIEDGVTGFFVPPGDKTALARKTRVLLEDAALRTRLGAAARARVQERFAVSDMVARFVEVYEAVSGPGRSRMESLSRPSLSIS